MTDSEKTETLKPRSKELIKIYIEYCINCESHQWCTNHKLGKYMDYVNLVKSAINREIPESRIIENDLPSEKSDKIVKNYNNITCDSVAKYTSKKGGKSRFPRVGAFEIYFKHKTVFSKLKNGIWPSIDKLANKLRAMVDNIQDGKKIMEGIEHKDMSESEAEEEPKYVSNKSSYVIPKVERRVKKKKPAHNINKNKPKEGRFISTPIVSQEIITNRKLTKKKDETDNEDDYENEFDDDKKSDKKSSSDDGYGDDDDFENENEDGKKEEKNIAKAKSEVNTPMNDKEEIPKSNRKPTTSKQIRPKYSTNQKTVSSRSRLDLNATKESQKVKTKISMFNSRVSNATKVTRRDKDTKERSQVKHYTNLNRSSANANKTRPNTYGNKSNLYNSHHVSSLTNIRAHSKKKLGMSFKEKRRPLSSRKHNGKKDKEILILVTKTYDLQLKVGKSNNKKISYVNKDEKE
jgi:hypothetical protein